MTSNTIQKPVKINSQFTYGKEKFSDIMFELPELFKAHDEEATQDKDGLKICVAWEKYLELEKLSILHLQTVRDGAKLIGYFIVMVLPHMHHVDTLFSYSDLIYIMPEYRNGTGIWSILLSNTEKMLKDLGVQKSVVTVKKGLQIRLLQHYGYRPTEENLTKWLGK